MHSYRYSIRDKDTHTAAAAAKRATKTKTEYKFECMAKIVQEREGGRWGKGEREVEERVLGEYE